MNKLVRKAVLSLAAISLSGLQGPVAAAAREPESCPRYGGDLPPSAHGPALPRECALYWRPFGRVQNPVGPPSKAVLVKLDRFINGVRSGKPDLRDMTPEMARAYGDGSPVGMPVASHTASPKSASFLGVDAGGNDVYAVALAGGGTYWEVHMDRNGQIDAAFFRF